MKKKLAKSKKKKGWALKEKIIASVSIFAITVSWTTIAMAAAISLNPVSNTGVAIGASTNSTSENDLASVPTTCCGTAHGRAYRYQDTNFGHTLCGNGTLFLVSKVSFPLPGETRNWRCACKDANGEYLRDEYGEKITDACWASREQIVKIKTCGNGKIEAGEQCDGRDFFKRPDEYFTEWEHTSRQNICTVALDNLLAFYYRNKLKVPDWLEKYWRRSDLNDFFRNSVVLKCQANCTLDVSDCFRGNKVEANLCGDGIIGPDEQCDGENFLIGTIHYMPPGEPYSKLVTCGDFGYTGGFLKCTKNCTYDISSCNNIGIPPFDDPGPDSAL